MLQQAHPQGAEPPSISVFYRTYHQFTKLRQSHRNRSPGLHKQGKHMPHPAARMVSRARCPVPDRHTAPHTWSYNEYIENRPPFRFYRLRPHARCPSPAGEDAAGFAARKTPCIAIPGRGKGVRLPSKITPGIGTASLACGSSPSVCDIEKRSNAFPCPGRCALLSADDHTANPPARTLSAHL